MTLNDPIMLALSVGLAILALCAGVYLWRWLGRRKPEPDVGPSRTANNIADAINRGGTGLRATALSNGFVGLDYIGGSVVMQPPDAKLEYRLRVCSDPARSQAQRIPTGGPCPEWVTKAEFEKLKGLVQRSVLATTANKVPLSPEMAAAIEAERGDVRACDCPACAPTPMKVRVRIPKYVPGQEVARGLRVLDDRCPASATSETFYYLLRYDRDPCCRFGDGYAKWEPESVVDAERLRDGRMG